MFGVYAAAIDNVAITTEMLEPVIDAVISNIGVILPVGVALLGIMVGISMVPRLLKKFSKG